MSNSITNPIFGAGVDYAVSNKSKKFKKFILIIMYFQYFHCLQDIDTLSNLLPIDSMHPIGHRGMAHWLVFACLVAFAVMQYFYREIGAALRRWWMTYAWFFLLTSMPSLLDAMVASPLGVAFFWPFDTTRYVMPWQPFLDVPMSLEVLRGPFWYATLVEGQFISLLLVGLSGILRLVDASRGRSLTRLPMAVCTVTADRQQRV